MNAIYQLGEPMTKSYSARHTPTHRHRESSHASRATRRVGTVWRTGAVAALATCTLTACGGNNAPDASPIGTSIVVPVAPVIDPASSPAAASAPAAPSVPGGSPVAPLVPIATSAPDAASAPI